jgi:MYXO-CTERM domain-containing protein
MDWKKAVVSRAMNKPRTLLSRRALLGALVMLATVLLSSTALAFGNVQVKNTNPEEVDGRWKLEMDINYGSNPPMGHIPFDFVFTLQTYYELSITDTDKEPVVRPKPMQNQTPQRESVDIDFADAKNKIWPRTKFQIAIKRDRGFEAGEYTLQIKRTDDGAILGQPIHLRFNGKNKLVDRRAVVFAAPEKKIKDAGAADPDGAAPEKKDEPAAPKNDEPTPGDDTPKGPPAEPPPKSHGCGCRLSDAPRAPAAAIALAFFGLALLGLRSRRR